MKSNLKLWPVYKHKALFFKILVSILILGLAYRLLFSQSRDGVASPIVETNSRDKTVGPDPDSSADAADVDDEIPKKDKCDLFTGNWVANPSGPIYTNETCDLIGSHQNCMKNGRPDSGYLYWRWSPRDCELPRFDAKVFLSWMRNKSWALIGDSLSQNHVQSLLCMLSTAEKAIEVYHDEGYKSKRWVFPSYNFTVSFVWSPFLVKVDIFEDIDGVSSSEVEVHLDKLDEKWTGLFESLDYMIISSGKWFPKSSIYYENNTIIGCHDCSGKNLTELGFDFAYSKALSSALNYITSSNHKGSIFLRTTTPDHFENGEWYSGGRCERKEPAKEGEFELKLFDPILHKIELDEFDKAAVKASERGVNLKLLDFNTLLLMRPDGHPGPYRHFYPFAKDKNASVVIDCLHWCIPGPMDSWNEVLMKMIING